MWVAVIGCLAIGGVDLYPQHRFALPSQFSVRTVHVPSTVTVTGQAKKTVPAVAPKPVVIEQEVTSKLDQIIEQEAVTEAAPQKETVQPIAEEIVVESLAQVDDSFTLVEEESVAPETEAVEQEIVLVEEPIIVEEVQPEVIPEVVTEVIEPVYDDLVQEAEQPVQEVIVESVDVIPEEVQAESLDYVFESEPQMEIAAEQAIQEPVVVQEFKNENPEVVIVQEAKSLSPQKEESVIEEQAIVGEEPTIFVESEPEVIVEEQNAAPVIEKVEIPIEEPQFIDTSFDSQTFITHNNFLNTWLKLASVNLNRPDLLTFMNGRNTQEPSVPAPVEQVVEQEVFQPEIVVIEPTDEVLPAVEETSEYSGVLAIDPIETVEPVMEPVVFEPVNEEIVDVVAEPVQEEFIAPVQEEVVAPVQEVIEPVADPVQDGIQFQESFFDVSPTTEAPFFEEVVTTLPMEEEVVTEVAATEMEISTEPTVIEDKVLPEITPELIKTNSIAKSISSGPISANTVVQSQSVSKPVVRFQAFTPEDRVKAHARHQAVLKEHIARTNAFAQQNQARHSSVTQAHIRTFGSEIPSLNTPRRQSITQQRVSTQNTFTPQAPVRQNTFAVHQAPVRQNTFVPQQTTQSHNTFSAQTSRRQNNFALSAADHAIIHRNAAAQHAAAHQNAARRAAAQQTAARQAFAHQSVARQPVVHQSVPRQNTFAQHNTAGQQVQFAQVNPAQTAHRRFSYSFSHNPTSSHFSILG